MNGIAARFLVLVIATFAIAGCVEVSQPSSSLVSLDAMGKPLPDKPLKLPGAAGVVFVNGTGSLEFYIELAPGTILEWSSGPTIVLESTRVLADCHDPLDRVQALTGGLRPYHGRDAGREGGLHRVLLWDEHEGPNFVVFNKRGAPSIEVHPDDPAAFRINGTPRAAAWTAVEPDVSIAPGAAYNATFAQDFHGSGPFLFFGDFQASFRFVGPAQSTTAIVQNGTTCMRATTQATGPASLAQPETLTVQVAAWLSSGDFEWSGSATAPIGQGSTSATRGHGLAVPI